AIIRSLNTRNGDHGGAALMMMRGRANESNLAYPDLGAVLAKEYGIPDSPAPDYVSFYMATEGRSMAPGTPGFLGSRYAPMEMYKGNIPDNMRKPENINEIDHRERAELRDA